MTYQDTVDQFMSDAAYRIGEIGMLLDNSSDDANADSQKLRTIRKQLSRFCSILRHTTLTIIDGTNFLSWSEYDVLREIQYLREVGGMNYLPIVNFQNYAPPVIFVQTGSSSGGQGLPEGSDGDSIFYNASNQPYADKIYPYGGWTGESIDEYFNDRA